MRRLRLPHKFLLIAVLLATPFAVVAKSYFDAQAAQRAFAEGERAGVVVVDPLVGLLRAVDGARAQAAIDRSPKVADVLGAVGRVDVALARTSGDIDVGARFNGLKAEVDAAADAGARGGPAAVRAWSRVSDGVVALVATVADQSKLTLDPVLVSYYLQDSLTVKLPAVIAEGGRAAALATGDLARQRDAVALAGATMTATSRALETNVDKAVAADPAVADAALGSAVAALQRDVAALDARLRRATATGRPPTGDVAAPVRRSAARMAGLVSPRLDGALAAQADGFRDKALTVALVAAAVALLALWLFVGFYRSMRASVGSLIGVLGEVEAGDLRRDAPTSPDEIGQMAVALNRTRGRVGEMVERIAGASRSLSRSSTELSAVADRMTGAAAQTADRAGSVSSAAEQISTSIQMVSAGTEEMGPSIHEIARQTSDAARVAGEAVTAAEQTNATMRRLSDSSAEIDEVIKLISSIAKQTNLLALNATIEAARAGDAGKGFAVVAAEIKELARDTAHSSERIERNVAEIQSGTRDTAQAISGICSTIHQISDIQAMIASAVEEQAATTSEISRSVSEVAGGSNEIAASVVDVAASARDANRAAVETQASAAHLAGLAQDLLVLTQRFRLAEQPAADVGPPPAPAPAPASAVAPPPPSWVDAEDGRPLRERVALNGATADTAPHRNGHG